MDEILIEDKKYISSKQAAKVTGYAKDYIGQLCREGRVPARFVGRNWYVLESAIQDHRFGSDESMPVESTKVDVKPEEQAHKSALPPTWEQPRYVATSGEELPSVNRLQAVEEIDERSVDNLEQVGANKTSENLEASWQEWFSSFNKMPDKEPEEPAPETAATVIQDKIEEDDEIEVPIVKEREIELDEEVSVPIHTVYELPPEELLPSKTHTDDREDEKEEIQDLPEQKQTFSRITVRVIQVFSLLLATIFASVALIGSGHLDKYISDSPVSIFAGVVLHNK